MYYSLPQLQALDYLLKKITRDGRYENLPDNLKFVIEVNGNYWSGDFVMHVSRSVAQIRIDRVGDVDYAYYYHEGPDKLTFLEKIWNSYIESLQGKNDFWSNPYRKIKDWSLLFHTLINLLDKADITETESPLWPYLLNAKSLDGKVELPFLNLTGKKINLVSIIER